jgi:glycosyltransferase involved in cell wall biosynthesis
MNSYLIVSTYPPRKCGIANFSKDLRDSLLSYRPRVLLAALDDLFQNYDYPPEVVWRIKQENKADYKACAHWANQEAGVDMIIIQHEYGIFGGPDGEYIMELARSLNKPFLLVTHTVLPRPSVRQHEILSHLAGLAAGVLCMTQRSARLLSQIYQVRAERIYVVPHGVDRELVYRLGVILVDLNNPELLIYRSPNSILEPEEEYEIGSDNSSWVPNVVFTCGAIPALEKDILEDDDEILVYYGAADTHIAVATATLAELIPAEYRR